MNGLRHLQTRRHTDKTPELKPNQKAFVRFVDRFAYLSIIVPILTIPQLIKIFTHHEASDLSLITWGTYLVSACYWTYYGWLHKAPPIWFPNLLMIIVHSGVVVGILLYQ